MSAGRSIVRTLSIIGLAGIALCATSASGELAGRIIDLTHAFDSETIFWPTEEGFVLEKGTEGVGEEGYYYAAHRFRTAGLDELPATGFSVVALPIKVRGGSGGPLRAIAILPDAAAGSSAAVSTPD